MRLLFCIGIFILSFSVKAQSVSGVVTDANAKVITEVMIYNLVSKMHAHSNNKGEFTIENTKLVDN